MSEDRPDYDGTPLPVPAAERVFREMASGRTIAFQRAYVDVTGKITAALMLSQLVFWQNITNRNPAKRGWFYKTQAEIEEETGLSRSEQDDARKRFKKCSWNGLPLVEEARRGVPAKMHYRVNLNVLMYLVAEKATNKIAGIPQTGSQEFSNLDGGNSANWIAGFPQTITEITQETTQEMTQDNPPAGAGNAIDDFPNATQHEEPSPMNAGAKQIAGVQEGLAAKPVPATVKPKQTSADKRRIIEDNEMCERVAAALGIKGMGTKWPAKMRQCARQLIEANVAPDELERFVAWMNHDDYWSRQAWDITALPGKLMAFRRQDRPQQKRWDDPLTGFDWNTDRIIPKAPAIPQPGD
jgi:hypothetical protein